MTLATHNLAVGYGKQIILDHVQVSLAAGEIACLVGPNGAGKSTLLRTMASLQPALGGTITLDDTPLSQLSRRQRAQLLSVVLTDRINPGRLSVEELVGIGRHPYSSWTGQLNGQDRQVVRQSLTRVGAEHLSHRQLSELSDGQQQRVLLARALAQQPQVLLLDEPTSFLDPAGKLAIFELLASLAHDHGYALMLSTHEVELAVRYADVLWVVQGDRVISGAPEDLIASGALAAPFSYPGTIFDLDTLTFTASWEPRAAASVTAATPELLKLTCHCLRRCGYRMVAADEHPDLHITVEQNRLMVDGQSFCSYAQLSTFLTTRLG